MARKVSFILCGGLGDPSMGQHTGARARYFTSDRLLDRKVCPIQEDLATR